MNTSEIVGSVGMDRFWAGYAWLPAARGDVSCALLHSGRNSTVLHTKLSACNHEIGQTEERVKPRSRFFVDDGAAMIVASTTVPPRIIKPLEAKCLLVVSKMLAVSLCFSNRYNLYCTSASIRLEEVEPNKSVFT